MIEHLVGRQGQPRGAQVHAVHLSDWKGWNLPDLIQVLTAEVKVSLWISLPTGGLLKVVSSSSFISVSMAAYLGLFSFVAAQAYGLSLCRYGCTFHCIVAPFFLVKATKQNCDITKQTAIRIQYMLIPKINRLLWSSHLTSSFCYIWSYLYNVFTSISLKLYLTGVKRWSLF